MAATIAACAATPRWIDDSLETLYGHPEAQKPTRKGGPRCTCGDLPRVLQTNQHEQKAMP
jgi:hypothetical protein